MKTTLWFLTLATAFGVVGTCEAGDEAARKTPAVFESSLGVGFARVPGTTTLLAVWKTRVKDYQVFLDATGGTGTKPEFEQTPTDPVVNVTWDEAMAFCQWLTARERQAGRLTAKQRYRLPTDREWSLAVGLGEESGATPEARLKRTVVWPWGATWPPSARAGNYAPELGVDTYAETSPVGSFPPNSLGFHDLGGNVWEWCDDWFNEARVTKALRGGSFRDSQPKDLLAAYRFTATVHLSNDDIGFRLALETAE